MRRESIKHLSLLGVVAAASILTGCASGLKHTKLEMAVSSKTAGYSAEEAGSPTSLISRNDTLIIASTKGITMLKSVNKLWFHELPEAPVRKVSFDRGYIAWSSYAYEGSDKAGFWSSAIFNAASVPNYKDSKLGLIDLSGNEKWTVNAQSTETAISAPAISSSSVAVSRGLDMEIYDINDGHFIAKQDIMNASFMSKLYGKYVRNGLPLSPAAYQDGYYAGSLFEMNQIDQTGKKLKHKNGFGLLSTFGRISAGPIVYKDNLYFATENTSNSEPPDRYGVVESVSPEKFKENFGKKYKKDKKSGFGAITAGGDKIFVATNTDLIAFSLKGKQLWAISGGQALYCSQARGLRYGNSWPFGYRTTTGNLILADEKHVYLSSPTSKEGIEAITVLSADKGEYVRSIEMKGRLLDMALIENQIAAITSEGLVYIDR